MANGTTDLVEFFHGIKSAVGESTIIAEDLGVITADVTELRESINAPGMVILQFAWGSDGKIHICHITTVRILYVIQELMIMKLVWMVLESK